VVRRAVRVDHPGRGVLAGIGGEVSVVQRHGVLFDVHGDAAELGHDVGEAMEQD